MLVFVERQNYTAHQEFLPLIKFKIFVIIYKIYSINKKIYRLFKSIGIFKYLTKYIFNIIIDDLMSKSIITI